MSHRDQRPDCDPFLDLLPRYAQGWLDVGEVARVNIHVARCTHCQADLVSYARVDESMRRYADQIEASIPSDTEFLQAVTTRLKTPLILESIPQSSISGDLIGPIHETKPPFPQRRSRPFFAAITSVALVVMMAFLIPLVAGGNHISHQSIAGITSSYGALTPTFTAITLGPPALLDPTKSYFAAVPPPCGIINESPLFDCLDDGLRLNYFGGESGGGGTTAFSSMTGGPLLTPVSSAFTVAIDLTNLAVNACFGLGAARYIDRVASYALNLCQAGLWSLTSQENDGSQNVLAEGRLASPLDFFSSTTLSISFDGAKKQFGIDGNIVATIADQVVIPTDFVFQLTPSDKEAASVLLRNFRYTLGIHDPSTPISP